MILCDIGNSFFHFCKNGKVWKESIKHAPSPLEEEIFYISVCSQAEQVFLKQMPHAINLAPFVELKSEYVGLGIDRKCACVGVENGVIVDAGSAITLDIMKEGRHLGGYILPGIASYLHALSSISERLNLMPDFSLDWDLIPQNTKEAMGSGMIKSIVGFIQSQSHGQNIYFAGGDGKFFSKFFSNGIYHELLVFEGMAKAVERYNEIVS